MKTSNTLTILSLLIAVLSVVAAGAGVFGQGQGDPVPFITPRGDTIMLQGHGLYRYDSLSGAAQAISGDVVTLILSVPLLLVSTVLARGGSLRGKLLLSGTLGYFLYTYTSIAYMLAYNNLFLLYVALHSLSVFAFVLSLTSIDYKALPAHFSKKTPRLPVAAFLFLLGLLLTMLWIGKIILPSLQTGLAPSGLDNYSTLVIQAMDLGLVIPAAFLSGVLWLKRSALGYLLTPVLLIKGMTMSAAVTAMVIGQILVGVQVGPVEIVLFPALAVIDLAVTWMVLSNVEEGNVREAVAAGVA